MEEALDEVEEAPAAAPLPALEELICGDVMMNVWSLAGARALCAELRIGSGMNLNLLV